MITKPLGLAFGTSMMLLMSSTAIFAQDGGGFSVDWSLEVGADSTFSSDVAADELTDFYPTVEAGITWEITDHVSFFSTITLEPVLDPTGDRAFKDLGIYVGELGLSFAIGEAEISVGKISPAFGSAWDSAPGVYGASFAEDYELAEMLGVTASFPLGSDVAGTLTVSIFHMDTTILSNSIGTKRGRNTTAAGGAGNTGKLNNFALDWTGQYGKTTYNLGARRLAKGLGDASNETGYAAGFSHQLNEQVNIIGEIAHFSGYGGSTDKANYATLGASFEQGAFTYSGSYTYRRVTSSGTDHLLSLGLEHTLANGIELSAGYAYVTQAGSKSHTIGLFAAIPIGS